MRKRISAKPEIRRVVKTEKSMEVIISRETLLLLLETYGIDVPEDAKIYVEVPDGGDWWGMDIGIDKVTPIRVTYKETKLEKPDEDDDGI